LSAVEIGLDRELFSAEFASDTVEVQMREEVAFARRSPIQGFPSLIVRGESGLHPIDIDYGDADPMRKQIEQFGRPTAQADVRCINAG
jgi:protein-disulfide isomerase-like protein with CxxC motif